MSQYHFGTEAATSYTQEYRNQTINDTARRYLNFFPVKQRCPGSTKTDCPPLGYV